MLVQKIKERWDKCADGIQQAVSLEVKNEFPFRAFDWQ